MKKVTREQFGKACLDYDLKSGTLINIDGVIGMQEFTGNLPDGTYKALGTIDEDLSTYTTAKEHIEWFGGDYIDCVLSDGINPTSEEDIRSIYEQLQHGLKDDVDITGKMVWGINAI
jgi:hypothetical protein